MGYIDQYLETKQTIMEESNSLKQNKMIEGVIDGQTASLAALNAGYGVVEARSPWKLIPPDEMRRKFQEVAQRKGLTLDRVADKINQHLEARANQTLNGKEVTQSEAPDNRVQQKAIEQLTSLLGIGDAQKASAAGSSITLSVTGAAADRMLRAFEGE